MKLTIKFKLVNLAKNLICLSLLTSATSANSADLELTNAQLELQDQPLTEYTEYIDTTTNVLGDGDPVEYELDIVNNLADFQTYLRLYRASLPEDGLTTNSNNIAINLNIDELTAFEARNIIVNNFPKITATFKQNTRNMQLKTGITWIGGATVLTGFTARHIYKTYQSGSFKQRKFWTGLLKLAGASLALDTAISGWSLHARMRAYRAKKQQIADKLVELGITPETIDHMLQKIETLNLAADTHTRNLQNILDTVGFANLRLYWEYR